MNFAHLSHEIENIGRDMYCVFKDITLMSPSQTFSFFPIFGKEAVGLRGTPILPTYNQPGFLKILLNER